jgi:hypothetical protein
VLGCIIRAKQKGIAVIDSSGLFDNCEFSFSKAFVLVREIQVGCGVCIYIYCRGLGLGDSQFPSAKRSCQPQSKGVNHYQKACYGYS